MNRSLLNQRSGWLGAAPARSGEIRGWPRWAPAAAVAWSAAYAGLALAWAVSGRGFPYAPEIMAEGLGPLAGQFGRAVAWASVTLAGLPAAAVGALMLRGVRGRVLRPLFIAAGALLAGALLLLMTDLTLLTTLAYVPFMLFKLVTNPAFGRVYLAGMAQWTFWHQVLCLIGGFAWLGATVSYARRSGEACLACGRRDGPEGWTSPKRAARWGRVAVFAGMAVPVIYALTRYAWALGIPLGMSAEHLREGQAIGKWIAGLFLANFGLVGAGLMLGLVQRWGEVFPRWMIGLAGRRVPIALAVVPAAIVSVLLMVGGLTITSAYGRFAEAAAATRESMVVVVGPTLLFPVWSLLLAVATLGYYFRRRGPCGVCGRGGP